MHRRHVMKGLITVAIMGSIAALVLVLGTFGGASRIQAQAQQLSPMEQRLTQVIGVLQKADPSSEAAKTAIDLVMEILYGGLRPLPSKGEMEERTTAADKAIRAMEKRFSAALGDFAGREAGRAARPGDQQGRALDLKLFIEEMSEVAQAVGQITKQCGDGDTTDKAPCDDLHALLEEETGQMMQPRSHGAVIRPSYSVKLRSPLVPPWLRGSQEDVRVTEPIATGACAVVFKETKGLMLRLHFERITVVTDPWVSVFSVPRGTPVPIWRLEWVPTEYVKEWNLCNVSGQIQMTVNQRVKQEIPVNFFWRFYAKDP